MREGYKQTEVGVIPDDWDIDRLFNLTQPQRPISYGIVQTGQQIPNGIKCIRVLDIVDGKIKDSDLITTSKEISNAYKRTVLSSGDLIIALRGKIGELAVVQEELEGSNLTRGIALIALKDNYTSVFYHQYLTSLDSKIRLQNRLNGSALQELPIATLRSFLVAIPPLLEQRAIAQALSDVDALITTMNKLIAKKCNLKTATMQQLLTGKKRLPGFGEGQGYKESAIGLIPEDWDVSAVGDICDFIVPGRNKPKIFKGNIPWITTPDLEDGRSVSTSKLGLFVSRDEAKSVGSKIVPSGAVIMSCVGDLGIVAFVEREIVINQQLHAFIPSPIIDSIFLLNALQAQQDFMLSIATQTAVPYLNKDNCNSIPIPLPSCLEQRAIATVLSDMDAEIAALESRLAKTQALKQGMMQELLTGRIRLKIEI